MLEKSAHTKPYQHVCCGASVLKFNFAFSFSVFFSDYRVFLSIRCWLSALLPSVHTMPTYCNASGITRVVASNKKARFLSKYGSRIGYVTKWRDAASIHLPMSVEAVSCQTSLAKLFTENRCELFCMMRPPFQSEMLQNTTASDMPDARSTHENVPQTDDP